MHYVMTLKGGSAHSLMVECKEELLPRVGETLDVADGVVIERYKVVEVVYPINVTGSAMKRPHTNKLLPSSRQITPEVFVERLPKE